MSERALRDACNFTWTTEKQVVPVLEKCLELAGGHDCVEEVDELVSIHKHVLKDCDELMTVMRVEKTTTVVDITVPVDFATCIIVIHGHFTKVIDDGYILIDPHAAEPAQRAVLERVTRRKADQVRLLRKVSTKCKIDLSGEDVRHPRPPHGHPPRPPERPPVRPPTERIDYVVQPGDTMFSIAQRFGIPLHTLIQANPQIRNPDVIIVGEIIRIPKRSPSVPPHRPGPTPGRRYVVRSGDTMFLIAQRFAVSLSELIAFNPQITNPNMLVPGQVVLIPTPGGAVG